MATEQKDKAMEATMIIPITEVCEGSLVAFFKRNEQWVTPDNRFKGQMLPYSEEEMLAENARRKAVQAAKIYAQQHAEWIHTPATVEITVCYGYHTWWDSHGGGEDWKETEVDVNFYYEQILNELNLRVRKGYSVLDCPCCEKQNLLFISVADSIYAEVNDDSFAPYANLLNDTCDSNSAYIVGVCKTTGKQFSAITYADVYEGDLIQDFLNDLASKW